MSLGVTNVFRTYEVYSSSNVAQHIRISREEEKRDIMTLSSQAKDFQVVNKALSITPDIREEKVNDIQNRINYGEYNITSIDLANKILENI